MRVLGREVGHQGLRRAVAAYTLSFAAPSAIQTALALRQAIWRKARPGWPVCGSPEGGRVALRRR